MQLIFTPEIRENAPQLRVAVVEAEITNGPTPDALWAEITRAEQDVRGTWAMEDIRHRPAIAAIRRAYKACGKEPNRYRPSGEALCRRCVKGLELYRTLTVIDLINLLSMRYGHSIGGFDRDAVSGEVLTVGVGREGEPYEAIGRGPLNIAGMPVIRDATGGIGTPTSDNERTKLTPDTTHLLMTVNLYDGGGESWPEMAAEMQRLLVEYAAAKNIVITEF